MTLPVTIQIVVLICTTIPFIYSEDVEIKWCHDASTAEACKGVSDTHANFKCVEAPNIYRCMQMVKKGTADVLYVSDTDLYPAGKIIGLKPILQIIHNDDANYRYKAVAVVKISGKVKSLNDLKDAKSCHTGAGKTTGWTTPVSNLIKKKIIPLKDCYSSIENIADFFTESCVPGAMTKRYNPFNLNPERLCGLCHKSSCSPTGNYSGYDGAKLCLEKTDADIAFVKHLTMLNADQNKYKLLCPDGKLKALNEFHDCNWAVRPSDTIVAASNQAKIADGLKEIFATLKEKFSWEKVKGLQNTDKDYSAIMGEGFKNTFEYYHNCKNTLRWCAISDVELEKCEDLTLAFAAKRATNKLECVKAKDHSDCMAKIEQNKADFVVLDGGDLEIAINDCKLQPVIAENYGFNTATYYTVAVVKATADFNVKQLKGKKSCHTGFGKTSGWKSPISYLIKNEMLPKGHSIPEEVGKFFNASCVPGALNKEYNPDGHNPKNLCQLCTTNCERNSNNPYYDYSGAFRCLVEVGDVAFIKHTTVPDNTDGNGMSPWNKDLLSTDFKLLCKNGSTAPIKDWMNCHFAKVPSHAIVTRKSDNEIGKLLFRIFNNFDLSSSDSIKLLFSSPNGKNLLFKDSTKGLTYIDDSKNFLGKDFLEILEVFGEKAKVCSGSSHLTISVTLVLFALVNYFA